MSNLEVILALVIAIFLVVIVIMNNDAGKRADRVETYARDIANALEKRRTIRAIKLEGPKSSIIFPVNDFVGASMDKYADTIEIAVIFGRDRRDVLEFQLSQAEEAQVVFDNLYSDL